MNITFQTEEQLIDYLILEKCVEWTNYDNCPFKFAGKEFNELDFLKYLQSFDLITYNYECIIHDTRKSNRAARKYELRVSSIQLNKKNLELLFSNELITTDIHQHRLLNINQVCEILGVTRPTIYKFFKDGSLPFYDIISQKKVRHSDLMNFIALRKNV